VESEVSRLQETVERLTERCAKGLGQALGTSTTRGTKGNAPAAPTGVTMVPTPPALRTHDRHRAVSAVPVGRE
jgi:hypothetical protein